MTLEARQVASAGLLALALGVVAADAAAQEQESGGAVVGYVAAGVSAIGNGELDDRLAAGGYPTFGRTAVAVAIGAYLLLEGGVVFGGEWHGLIMDEHAHDGRDVGLGGGYGTLGVGYALELSRRVRIYPRLGLGGGGMGFWIQRAGEEVGFDEVLANPELYARPDTAFDAGSDMVMNRGGVVVDLGGGAELLPGGWGRGLLIGVRLGYLVAPFEGTWRMDEHMVSGGPAATIGGPYLRIMIGGGGGMVGAVGGDRPTTSSGWSSRAQGPHLRPAGSRRCIEAKGCSAVGRPIPEPDGGERIFGTPPARNMMSASMLDHCAAAGGAFADLGQRLPECQLN